MKTSKNALCPCGSAKKYKRCHGLIAEKIERGHSKSIKKIIYDINVWFKISKGESLTIYNKNELALTYSNATEICFTPRLKGGEFEFIKQSMKVMLDKCQLYAIVDPIEYLIKIENPHYFNELYGSNNSLLDFMSNIANGITKQDEIDFQTIENRQQIYKNAAQSFTSKISNVTAEHKAEIAQSNQSKDLFREMDHSDFAKHVVKDLVRIISPDHYELSPNYDWSKVELLIKVFEQFLKKAILENWAFKKNDWNDLFNMVFVSPGDKYLTYDDRWSGLIADAKMIEKYSWE